MPKVKVLNNLESVGDMIGSLKGISDGLDDQRYMQTIIRDAHDSASNAFNLAAAATGGAGLLQHMFEFGTARVTKGQPKFQDPTSEAARLWVHTITGMGGQQDIGYTFRPALNRNPIPTTRETGVPSKYLRKISKRKYVFHNKAMVTELGQTVEIKAKRSDFLFVPFGNKPATNRVNKRGFVMYNTRTKGPIESKPGKTTQGSFQAFWMEWWSNAGSDMMEEDMRKRVTYDITKAESEAERRANAHRPEPVQTVNIIGAVAKAKAYAKKLFESRNYR